MADAIIPYLREHFGNPSSAHAFGQRAKLAVAQARAQVAARINARADEIVFTGNATEANNLGRSTGTLNGGTKFQLSLAAGKAVERL